MEENIRQRLRKSTRGDTEDQATQPITQDQAAGDHSLSQNKTDKQVINITNSHNSTNVEESSNNSVSIQEHLARESNNIMTELRSEMRQMMGNAMNEFMQSTTLAMNQLSNEMRQATNRQTSQQTQSRSRSTTRFAQNVSSDEDTEYSFSDEQSQVNRGPRGNNSCKLPPFTGKEKWNIWFNRVKEVATLQQWGNQQKLRELLPILQGPAGEFVYGQLTHETRTSYSTLASELNSRFRVVDTKRTYGAQFSKCVQKSNQTAEEFAAELKMLYDKAHANRDRQTRTEDLLRRFLDGLNDERARFHIEFVKEPSDIDQAVFEVVNFQETRRRPGNKDNYEAKPIRSARVVHEYQQEDFQDEPFMVRPAEDEDEDEDEDERLARIPVKGKKAKITQPGTSQTSVKTPQNTFSKLTSTKKDPVTGNQQMLTVFSKLEQRLQKLEEQGKKPSQSIQNFKQGQNGRGRFSQDRKKFNKDGFQCFKCGNCGHFAKECPYPWVTGQMQMALQPPMQSRSVAAGSSETSTHESAKVFHDHRQEQTTNQFNQKNLN